MDPTVETQIELSLQVARLCPHLFLIRPGTFVPLMTYWNIDGEQGAAVTIPSDLNACAEFEKGLNGRQVYQYTEELRKVMGLYGGQGDSSRLDNWEWHATAEQRCRAFVATMEAYSVGRGNAKQEVAPLS